MARTLENDYADTLVELKALDCLENDSGVLTSQSRLRINLSIIDYLEQSDTSF